MFSAHAKINIGLFVVEKRPDGYHDLLTVFHRVDLADTLRFSPADTILVRSDDPAAPGDETNLCHRAASALRSYAGRDLGVRITLEKRIPVGAGLGGGSSDAASVLLHLPAFWGISIDEATRRTMALALGSDVPYFLGKSSAIASGRGEILDFFDLDIPYTILLCTPPIHIATRWAYGQVKPRRPPDVDLRRTLLEGLRDPAVLAAHFRNDFEPAVFSAYPAIAELKTAMLDRGAVYASLSGSGSSVFGFFSSSAAAAALAASFRDRGLAVSITSPSFRP